MAYGAYRRTSEYQRRISKALRKMSDQSIAVLTPWLSDIDREFADREMRGRLAKQELAYKKRYGEKALAQQQKQFESRQRQQQAQFDVTQTLQRQTSQQRYDLGMAGLEQQYGQHRALQGYYDTQLRKYRPLGWANIGLGVLGGFAKRREYQQQMQILQERMGLERKRLEAYGRMFG